MINICKKTIPTAPILTAKQMRKADQYTIDHGGLSAAELMERAGQAVAKACQQHKLDSGRIVIIIGAGNNAGDGLVAARLLREQRMPVTVIPLLPFHKFNTCASDQIALAKKAGVKIRPINHAGDLPKLKAWLSRAVIVVDAIFGTGLTRAVTGWLAEAIEHINQAHCPILSVDIASGIHADSGKLLGMAIKAGITLPITAYKWGYWLQQGSAHAGLICAPATIGICPETIHNILENDAATVKSYLIAMPLIQQAFPQRPAQAFKQRFGHLWIFGGSEGYTGAPKLAAMGAQAVGTGLVSIACPRDVYSIIAASSLEAMVHPQEHADSHQANAVVAGCGWNQSSQEKLTDILRWDIPAILDAQALNMLSQHESLYNILKNRGAVTVLTPHVGEAARLLKMKPADIQEDRVTAALALVDQYHAWVVLKGAQTLIVSPQKQLWLNPFGSVNLATAGTGDVLAGMIGGLLATGIAADIAIPAAVGLHGLAGEQANWHRAGQLEAMIANQLQTIRSRIRRQAQSPLRL
ncbi:MAG: NAD(P)H-hydrate dehydratase [Mariprofundaceae bacterium]|nr:NAD(P)H-hydrate dehydratase [Mariprofundaceae bacterium]